MEEEQNTEGEPANGEMDVKTEPDSLLMTDICSFKIKIWTYSDYLILFLRTHSVVIHHLWHWMAYNVLMCR